MRNIDERSSSFDTSFTPRTSWFLTELTITVWTVFSNIIDQLGVVHTKLNLSFVPSCNVAWSGAGEKVVSHLSYVAFIYVFGFIIPVSIIVTCYVKIIKTVKLKV